MSPERRCGTCRWWAASAEDVAFGFTGPLYCRRRAPMPLSITITLPGSKVGNGPAAAWPRTHDIDWCGEWAAREEGPDA